MRCAGLGSLVVVWSMLVCVTESRAVAPFGGATGRPVDRKRLQDTVEATMENAGLVIVWNGNGAKPVAGAAGKTVLDDKLTLGRNHVVFVWYEGDKPDANGGGPSSYGFKLKKNDLKKNDEAVWEDFDVVTASHKVVWRVQKVSVFVDKNLDLRVAIGEPDPNAVPTREWRWALLETLPAEQKKSWTEQEELLEAQDKLLQEPEELSEEQKLFIGRLVRSSTR